MFHLLQINASELHTLDWSILAGYFLVLIIIGIWASTKRKKGSSLFLAENSLRWHHIGFSMWGTNVGPSMLIASASAGFTTGIVSGNFAWYAFIFICDGTERLRYGLGFEEHRWRMDFSLITTIHSTGAITRPFTESDPEQWRQMDRFQHAEPHLSINMTFRCIPGDTRPDVHAFQ